METPERDFCPLIPLPAVFPLPEPTPLATRFFFLTAPSLSLNSLSFMSLLLLPELPPGCDERGKHSLNLVLSKLSFYR